MSERGSYVTQFMYRDEEERRRIRIALGNAALNPMEVMGDNKILAATGRGSGFDGHISYYR